MRAVVRGFLVMGLGALVTFQGEGEGARAQTAPPRTTTIPPASTATPPAAAPGSEPAGGDLKRRLRDLKDEPSTEVKDVPVQDPGTRIREAPAQATTSPERRAPGPEPREDNPATLPELPVAQRRALFATPGYQQRFEELQHCREEVSLARKVRPAEVRARGVQLRWMVGADGEVQGVEVVAMGATDPDVMSCVHRKVESWRISPPPNMPYRTSHRLSFTRR